jgi:hypothetical protein
VTLTVRVERGVVVVRAAGQRPEADLRHRTPLTPWMPTSAIHSLHS